MMIIGCQIGRKGTNRKMLMELLWNLPIALIFLYGLVPYINLLGNCEEIIRAIYKPVKHERLAKISDALQLYFHSRESYDKKHPGEISSGPLSGIKFGLPRKKEVQDTNISW
ncbi:unnamed protein product [Allacma fusca]|uniref:Uncharacterized protein n=1 Tax=Allacma fusca TaxID=39272 RepID=A0A8J2PYF5_9HEXA|nr:unnamed protein product [Allacma fusca]